MSAAQVTEAHKQLAYAILFASEDGHAGPNEATQLIAASEAKAVGPHAYVAAQLAAVLTECVAPEFANSEHALQWAKGIAQLRSECNNLRAKSCQCAYDEACAHVLRAEHAEAELKASRYETVKAAQARLHECIRAERAEAELAGIRALADRRNKRDHSQDTTHQLVTALDQALDIAQAELAAERARLDAVVANCWAVHSEGGSSFSVFSNVCGDYIATAQTYRAAIDAAMKGGAK